METLNTLITRVFDICSTDEYMNEEIEYIWIVFHHRNNYPLWVINKVIDDAKKVPSADQTDSSRNDKIHRLMLPYQGDNKSNLLKSVKRYVSKLLPEHEKLEITFTGKNLNSWFSAKDKKFWTQHDLIYYVHCKRPSCCVNYDGDTGRRLVERIKDHSNRDYDSHMVKQNIETSPTHVNTANFKIIDINFSNNFCYYWKLPNLYGSRTWDLHQMYRRNQYLWTSLIKQSITKLPTNELWNIGIIILIVYSPWSWKLLLSFRVLLVYRFYWFYFENGYWKLLNEILVWNI